MNSLTLLAITLCLFALAYRYYSAFLAAKVAILDPRRPTPAHQFRDGHDYHPTNKYVLFGHHFAAIAGAGPLIGPVLAAQYGYLPGALWILVGSVFAGAVHDYISLYASVRNGGESISRIAHKYLGGPAGWCTGVAILFIIVVALAGLALVVVNALSESAWAVFTIACSIPIAFLMGQWMYKIRPGKVTEATIVGVILLMVGVIAGGPLSGVKWFTEAFTYKEWVLKLALPTYGFIAAALPVWMLLCPRDYLSSYMKIGTVALLAIGIFVVRPELQFPATANLGGGPIIPGPVWPYVCLTIACGAISGFHSLIGSGTTPKMINNESDIRFIGYGAMLTEAFVGIMALIAACALQFQDYLAINVKPEVFGPAPAHLAVLARQVGEASLAGRTGGSVTLAVGMAQVFGAIPGMKALIPYWYHFAIMFEALFILTTIDTGTRVARFILHEIVRGLHRPHVTKSSLPATIATSALVSFFWGYLLWGGSVQTIWPMFGVANQLLAIIALAIGTTFILLKSAKRSYALLTFVPFVFMAVTVLTAGVRNITSIYLPIILGRVPNAADKVTAMGIMATLTAIMIGLTAVVIVASILRWGGILTSGPRQPEVEEPEPEREGVYV
ncbi:MAG: carbon starvation protein A [Armatimonadota bacterium]|nr:carbon starvation protein A [Armatimonadota bacterium]